MSTRPSPRIIRFIVQFALIFAHIFRAGKIKPSDDFYESSSNETQLSSPKFNKYYSKHLHNHLETNDTESNELQSTQFDGSSNEGSDLRGQASDQKFNQYKRLAPNYTVAWFIHRCSLLFNIYILVKYIILCPLDSELFESYRYIDCILIGRFCLDGRAVSLARYIALLFSAFNTIWRAQMYFFNDRYESGVLEFMATDVEDVLVDELKYETLDDEHLDEAILHRNLENQSNFLRRRKSLTCEEGCRSISVESWLNPLIGDSKTSVGHEIRFDGIKSRKYRRPVRTTEAWFYIANNLITYSLIALVTDLCLTAFLLSIHTPMLLTQLGFVLTQDHCVEWIVGVYKQSARYGYESLDFMQRFSLNYIHQPNSTNFTITNDMKTIWIGYEDFVHPNLYHLLRISINFFETAFLYFETVAFLFSGYMLILINVRQARYYTQFIRRELEALQLMLQEMNLVGSISSSYLVPNQASSKKKPRTSESLRQVELHTQRVQGMMIDLFKTIRASNVFISDYTIRCLCLWFAYSALAVGWMFQPGPFLYTSKFECYFIHAFATSYLALLVGTTSKVRSETVQLYKLSAHCMAISSEQLNSKTRWCEIIHFYHPHPMNCFTVQNVQLSWLLLMKVVAWLFSALFVVSTFYAYYQ